MHPIHGPGRAPVVSERPENFARKIELVDLSNAPDINHLSRPGRDAERPGRARKVVPNLFEVALGVKDLDAAVATVGHVQGLVLVDDDAVRCTEITLPVATLAPRLHKVAFFVELCHARVAVAVGNEDAAIRRPGHVGRLIERALTRNGVLDYV